MDDFEDTRLTGDEEDLSYEEEIDDDGEEMSDDEYANLQIYKEDSEKMPKAPAYDTEFVTVHESIARIIEGLEKTIPSELREHSRFKHLYNSTAGLKTLQHMPSRHHINIVGKSGAGKSSLLNSILGRPQLAKALAASKGCTHVPTTYESRFQEQTKVVAAKIEFFTLEEIRIKIKLMLKDYHTWLCGNANNPASEEMVELRTAAATAFDAFRSLFCARDEFSSGKGEQFLIDSDLGDPKYVIQKMVDWCDELIQEAQEGNEDVKTEDGEDDASSVADSSDRTSCLYKEFDSPDELAKSIEPFSFSDSKYSKSALWPLVKMIRQGLGGIKLLQTNTITDWPGSEDTNRLRAKASAERVYHCDEIWIVSPADRIGTDPTTISSLVRCTVICTCIDDKLDEGLANEMEKEGHDIGNHDDLLSKEKELLKRIRANEGKIRTPKEALRLGYTKKLFKRVKLGPKTRNHWTTEMPELQLDLQDDQDEHQDVAQKRFHLLIPIRKDYIKNMLRDTISRHLSHSRHQVRLYCVSNLHYNMHTTGRAISGPRLSVEATGIPGLRRYVYKSAAPRILENVKDFIRNDLSGLLHSANIVANPECFEGGDAINEMITSKCASLHPYFNQYLGSVRSLAMRELKDVLDAQETFPDAALKRLEEKADRHWCSIKAFARREGCHKTPKQRQQSWNEHFMEAVTLVLNGKKNNGHWRTFETDEKVYANALKSRLIDESEDIACKLEGDTAGFPLPKEELRRFMDGQTHSIEELVSKFQANLAKSLLDISSNRPRRIVPFLLRTSTSP